MSKHVYFGLRVAVLAAVATLMLALAACTGIPGLPSTTPANTPTSAPAAQATSVPKAAAPKAAATTAPAPTQAAQAGGAPKAAATAQPEQAAPKVAATVQPAQGAPKAAATAQATVATGAAAAGAATATVPQTSAPAGSTAVALEGPVWKLESYADNSGQTVNALPNTNVTAEFKAGRVNGNAGCNTYFAGYKVDGNKLTISAAGSTMMACADPAVMAQESAYLQALGKAATYQITGDTLAISDANGNVILTFKATPAPTLTSNPWSLISYNNGKQAVVGLQPGSEITAVFGPDGKVTGSAGCNTYTAPYTADGNKIKVGAPATTRKACAQPIMDQEAAYLKALQTAATWSIFNGQLNMRTAQDAQAVNYVVGTTAALPGSNWNLTGVNNGRGAVESIPTGVEATAKFGADGRVTGSGGCNTYNIPFTVDGSNIKFGVGITTQMACPEPQMQTEVLLLKAFEASTKWSIDNGMLFLRDASGAIQATFEPAK
ncbi:MAG: META domain-containing protein [Anaerolineae bacterium]